MMNQSVSGAMMRFAYGTLQLLVTPTAGSGEWWVNADSLTFIDPTTLRQ